MVKSLTVEIGAGVWFHAGEPVERGTGMMKRQFGVVGLGVMGRNLALNIARHGFSTAGFDLDPEKRAQAAAAGAEWDLSVAADARAFLDSLAPPRRILIMVPAGRPVDAVIASLRPRLRPGDVLIDGGNSFYEDTRRRVRDLGDEGILFVGAGVSGGEEGALRGPALMPGGNRKAWPLMKPVFQKIAARAPDGAPCCEWIGPDGAGHFVKMAHNGIEYGDMQLIGEAFFLMERVLGLDPAAISAIFADWNKGALNSYLIGITSRILARKDPDTGRPLVHAILDTAEQKGTGKWTAAAALDLGAPAPTLATAVFARMLSALKAERLTASRKFPGPRAAFRGSRKAFVEMIRQALYASKICAYAQGFQLLKAADDAFRWRLRFGAIASGWRAGCIIRARFLSRIAAAYARWPDLPNLLLDPYFAAAVRKAEPAWREVVAAAARHGVPAPAFSSALTYFDSYRTAVLPANLLQAQRDYFGAHTYRRNDKEGVFHTRWEDDDPGAAEGKP